MEFTSALKTLWQRPGTRWFGALALAWLILNLPVLAGIRVLPWDAMDEFYPVVYFNAHTLRLGQWPWWNPYLYGGFPQIADPQGMLFSPLMMAWMLLRSAPGATWFDWGVLLHLLLGGSAMMALLRRSGGNAFGALLGAIVFMAGGVAAARLEHVPDVLAYGWSPVVLLALRHLLAEPGWRRGLLFGLAAAAMVTQLVQLTYLLVLMIAGYAMAAMALHWHGYSPLQRRRLVGGMLLAGLVALLGGLPQLLFTWAFTMLSNRAVLPLSAATHGSLDWRALLSLLDPNVWHALRGSYDGPASRVEGYLYIGVVPMLMMVGLRAAWRQQAQRRQLLFFGAVAVLACLYMFGVHTPFYGWLYGWLPGMAQFRRPSDAAYLLNFSLAMFAGLAASHFRLESRRRVLVLLAIAVPWLALASANMRGDGVHWQVATVLASAVALLAWWRLAKPGTTRRTAIWLVVILLVDYRCFNLNGSFNQYHDSAQRFRHDAAATWLVHALVEGPDGLPARIEPVRAGIKWDNLVLLRQLHSTQGYNPLRYGLYDRWYGAHEDGDQVRPQTPFNRHVGSKLDDLLGVRYVVVGHAADRGLAERGLEKILAGDKVDVWRNHGAYPRLLNPSVVRLLAPGQLPDPAAFEATDFSTELWLTPRDQRDQQGAQKLSASCSGRIDVTDIHAKPSQIDLHTRARTRGWLVLSDLDFPGWQAQLDGEELPIHRANGMFRAVCVPAGEHHLRFVFRPWRMVAEVWQRERR